MKKGISLLFVILMALMPMSAALPASAAEVASAGGESDVAATSENEPAVEPTSAAPTVPAPTIAPTVAPTAAPVVIKYPEITKIENLESGVKITWNTYENNKIYRIYYCKAAKESASWNAKYSSKNWVRLAEVKGNTYTHKNLPNAQLGIYTVRCVNSSGSFTSDFNREGWENRYYSAPVISSLKNAPTGVKITWTRAKYAQDYAVYRKVSGGWKRLTKTSASEYIDTSPESGKTHTYTLRMITADGSAFMSGFNSGKSIHYVAAPVVKSVTNQAASAKITWDKVAGATYYRLTYWNGKSWTLLTETKSTNYTDTTVKDGQKREYTLTALDANKKAVSDYHRDGYINTFFKPPVIQSLSMTQDGVKITWKRPSGAQDYRIYRKDSSGWTRLAQTAGSEYTDTAAISGKTNTYTIRMVTTNGNTFMSDYLSGKSIAYVKAPVINSFSNTASGVQLSWDKSAGATYYRVYSKNGGAWTRLAQISGTSYTDTAAKEGQHKVYTIRCVDKNGNFVSDFYRSGFENVYAITPVLQSLTFENGHYILKWNKPAGIAAYRVYRKDINDKDWSRVADMYNGSEFVDTSDQTDKIVAYTLRAQDESGKLISSFISNPFYYNGAVANGTVLSDGQYYRLNNGTIFNGFYREDGALNYYHNGIRTTQEWYRQSVYTGTYTRAQWLCELMRYSGDDPGIDESDENAVFELAKERGIITDYIADDLTSPADRLFIAHTMVKALNYPARSIGTVSDSTDADLSTLAYYGYFIPDKNNNLYPDKEITVEEFDMLISELKLCQQLRDKIVVVFGDSIMYGAGNVIGTNKYEGIAEIIGKKYGMTYKCYAKPGAVMGKSDNKSHIPDQIRTAVNNGQKADLIIFNGGTNDAWQKSIDLGSITDGFDMKNIDETTYTNAFEKSVWMMKSQWKNVPIIYVRSHKMKLGTQEQQMTFGNRAMALAEKWNLGGVDLYNKNNYDETIYDNPSRYTFDDDALNRGIHPTALGYAKYYLSPVAEIVALAFGD